jgi:acetylornithine aminotransferase
VEADIYSMAKGMGNGFPIGGIIISPKLKAKHGMLGTTFGGNHLACAAALAVLEVIEKEHLMQNATKVGEFLSASLKSIEAISAVRGRGLMIGFDVPEKLKNLKKDLLFKYKIFTGEAKPNVMRLLPSLAITMEEAALFIQQLKHAIEHYQD